MKQTAVVIFALTVSGCASLDCKTVKITEYPKSFEKGLADEIAAAPPEAHWPAAILDYRRMREAVRNCQK